MTDSASTQLVAILEKENWRPRNAVKHGAFSNLTVLPGEDFAAFKKLYEDLQDEFKPSGAMEVDLVLDLAKFLFRKRNLGVYRRAETARKLWAPYLVEHSDPHVVQDLAFKARAGAVMEACSERFGNKEALENNANLVPACEAAISATKKLLDFSEDDIAKAVRDQVADFHLALCGEAITPEGLDHALDVIARLDAMIDRTVKRLMQLKAMKSMAGLGSAAQA